MRKFLLPVLLVLLPLFSACATKPTLVEEGARLLSNDQRGIAIVSVTLNDDFLEKFSQFGLIIQPVNSKTNDLMEISVKEAMGRGPVPDIVVEGKAVGRVLVAPLPAGEYRLMGWRAFGYVTPTRKMLVTPNESSLPGYQLFATERRFTVTPEQFSYIGNLDIRIENRRQKGTVLLDQSTRDLGLVQQRWGVNPAKVHVALAR